MDSVNLEVFNGSEWKVKVINLDPDDFSIDDQALDAEMCAIGSKMYFYSNLSAELYAQAQRKKNELEITYAQEASIVRMNFASEKATEGKIKEKVLQTDRYRQATEDYVKAEADHKRVENLYKSINKVADIMISINYKQGQELKKMGGYLD